MIIGALIVAAILAIAPALAVLAMARQASRDRDHAEHD